MPKKTKLSTSDFWINKTILGILLVIFAAFSIIGYATNILVGAIFMLFFIAVFGMVVELDKIKKWLDDNVNNRKW